MRAETRIYAPAPKQKTPQHLETHRQTRESRRQAIRTRRRKYQRRRWSLFLVFVLLLATALLLTNIGEEKKVNLLRMPVVQSHPEPPPPSASELEARLKKIAGSHNGTYEAVVFDPDSGQTVGLNADRPFMAASLAKLPVLLTLYEAAARNEIDLEEKISILPSDVQNYGTGVLNGYPVGSTMTLRECATFLIKESDNTAWVMLERRLGRSEIEAELQTLGARNTSYQDYLTTPRDVMLMLRAIADPKYTTPELSSEMLSLMTSTAYEDRLPQPLPKSARVAHKIGSYESTFSDAGVVFHDTGKGHESSYFVVVAGEGAREDEARSAIRQMSLVAYQTYMDPLAGRAPARESGHDSN